GLLIAALLVMTLVVLALPGLVLIADAELLLDGVLALLDLVWMLLRVLLGLVLDVVELAHCGLRPDRRLPTAVSRRRRSPAARRPTRAWPPDTCPIVTLRNWREVSPNQRSVVPPTRGRGAGRTARAGSRASPLPSWPRRHRRAIP